MTFRTAIIGLAISGILVAGCSGAVPTTSPSGVPSLSPVEVSAGPTATASPEPVVTEDPSNSPQPTAAACVAPVSVSDFGGWPGSPPIDQILRCFGDRDFVVTGYLAPPEGIGGIANGITPTWLGEWSGLPVVLHANVNPADTCGDDVDCSWAFLFAPKPALLPLTPARWVRLTGHFDDPVAATCRATPGYEGQDGPETDAQAIATCRGHFVVTKIQTVPPPA